MRLRSNFLFPVVGAFLLSGCVDDAYDLSNIDTSAELKVNGLALPLNIEDITLDDVINVNNNGRIRVVNGEYVLFEEGEFESDNLMIDPIHADAPDSDKTVNYLDLVLPEASELQRRAAANEPITAEYHLKEDFSNYRYEISNLSEHLVSLKRIEAKMSVSTKLRIEGLNADDHLSIDFKDITIHLPKGLEISNHPGVYDTETGTLTIDHLPTVDNGVKLDVDIEGIDFEQAGLFIDQVLNSMTFDEKFTLAEGKIVVVTDDISKLPKQIGLTKECDFSDIDVTSFTGAIKYDFDGFDIAPIYLTDLPAVLTQEQTDLHIANPQIYLSINNPAAPYKVSAQTGLKFTTHRSGLEDKEYTLDNGYFTLGYEQGTGNQLFCLSPDVPETFYEGFDGATHVPFSTLGDVLSGNGVPTSIDISLVNPCIPEQMVENVEIGVDMGKVKGRYLFYSPLALAKESIIVYNEIVDGLSSDVTEDLTISQINITADISTDLPIGAKMAVYPMDKNGNRIQNVQVSPFEIPANAKAFPLDIVVTGEITDLDGIMFEAVAQPDGSETSLKPSQSISLKGIKVRVSGKYTTKL